MAFLKMDRKDLSDMEFEEWLLEQKCVLRNRL